MSLTDFAHQLLDLEPEVLQQYCLDNPDMLDVVEAALAQEDLEQFIAGRELAAVRRDAEVSGTRWMSVVFPRTASSGFAPHMEQLWWWIWSIQHGVRPPPFVAIWFRGAAKALAVDTPIPTPHGFVPMGDVQPGTIVFDHSGTPVSVTGVSPIEERSAYRVGFKSGASIVASGDHLWAVADRRVRRAWHDTIPADWPTWEGDRSRLYRGVCSVRGCDAPTRFSSGMCSAHLERMRRLGHPDAARPVRVRSTRGRMGALRTEVLTTEQLLMAGIRDRNEYRWGIPTAGDLQLPDSWVPIEPYLLGVWLGDGTSSAGVITVGYQDADNLEELLAQAGCRMRWADRPACRSVTVDGLRRSLRLNDLLGNKHIPAAYLRSSPKQRLALLQGLLDTDGTPHKAGASFTATRQVLAVGVAELARSLGMRANVSEGRATLDGRDCGPVWHTLITGDGQIPLFRLRRKAARQMSAPTEGGVMVQMQYVTSIDPIGTALVRCITVDSPGHCFLAGDAMIPTHNSSTAEAACAAMGARGQRRYGLYISDTQDQADEHVANIGTLLGNPRFAALYPEMSERAVTQYGSSRGWNRKRLHTAAGFVVDALGLASNARGIRVDEERPDFIILDDVDNDLDGPAMVEKKIDLITKKILPSGSADLAVLAIQNLVHPNSIFSRLAGMAEVKADFLSDRIISGPIPAVEGLQVEVDEEGKHIVVGGTPTWEGYDLQAAQDAIMTFGYSSFLSEAQHITQPPTGGLFGNVKFVHCTAEEVPPLAIRTCWVDPAIEGDDSSDSQGIQIDGMSQKGVVYRLWSWEGKTGPQETFILAIRQAIRMRCSTLGVETDNGGKAWRSVYNDACQAIKTRYCGTCWAHFEGPHKTEDEAIALRDAHCLREDHEPYRGGFPTYLWDKAGAGKGGKAHRGSQMLADYEIGGRIVHVTTNGTHEILEAGLKRFLKVKPFDLADAAYWSWKYCKDRRNAMNTGRSARTVARARLPRDRFTS